MNGPWHLFYTSYGPKVIRPLQVIGMYWEAKLFSLAPLPSHLLSTVWLSLGQGVLYITLRKQLHPLAAFAGVVVIGTSVLAGEPRYWLSDRHDLYLLFFFATSLFFATRIVLQKKHTLLSAYTLLSISYWGGFYSNEKGTATPALICLFMMALWIARRPVFSAVNLVRELTPLILVSLLNTAAYFLLRYKVLGALIGGYNDRLIPGKFKWELIPLWLEALLSIPFRQNTFELIHLALWIGVPALIWLIAISLWHCFQRGRALRAGLIIIVLITAILFSSLPTLQFTIGGIFPGTLNCRMLWLPLITTGICMAALFDCALRSRRSMALHGASVAIILILLLLNAYGGRAAANNFARANDLSRMATAAYREYCACIDMEGEQFTGLQRYPYGVSTFSEDAWLKQNALWEGMPACKSQPESERCLIEFHQNGHKLHAVPSNVSASRLSQLISPFRATSPTAKSEALRFELGTYHFLELAEGGIESVTVNGWVKDKKTRQPVQLLALYVDNQIILATPPNIYETRGKKKRRALDRFGFQMTVSAGQLPADPGKIKLIAFQKVGKRTDAVILYQAQWPGIKHIPAKTEQQSPASSNM